MRPTARGLPHARTGSVRYETLSADTRPVSSGACALPLSRKFLGERLTPVESSLASRCVAAYLVRVGAMVGRVTPDPSRLASLPVRLPPQSRMAQRTPCGAVDPGSDDEVWLRDEPAPPCVHVLHAHPSPPIRPRGCEATCFVWRDRRLKFFSKSAQVGVTDTVSVTGMASLQLRCL